MIWSSAMSLVATIALASPAPAALADTAATTWELSVIGTLPGHYQSWASDISDSGIVVGASDGGPRRAFRWEGGEMTALDSQWYGQADAVSSGDVTVGFIVPLGYLNHSQAKFHPAIWQEGVLADPFDDQPYPYGGKAFGVNARGDVVGEWHAGESPRGFIWSHGELTDLGTFGHYGASATAINARGTVAGTTHDLAANGGLQDAEDFLLETATGALTFFPATDRVVSINDEGQVLVQGTDGTYLWRRGAAEQITVPGCIGLAPSDLNDRGDVVGSCQTEQGPGQAFIWSAGTGVLLPHPAGLRAAATAANNRGQVVGSVDSAEGRPVAAIWDKDS